MTIEIGSVVVLKSGSVKMVVRDITVGSNQRSGNGNECPLCGPYPRLDSSEPQVMATMLLAQQQWRTRHDAHAKIESEVEVTCSWMYEGSCRDATFPVEALREVEEATRVGDAEAPRPTTLRKRPFRSDDSED